MNCNDVVQFFEELLCPVRGALVVGIFFEVFVVVFVQALEQGFGDLLLMIGNFGKCGRRLVVLGRWRGGVASLAGVLLLAGVGLGRVWCWSVGSDWACGS